MHDERDRERKKFVESSETQRSERERQLPQSLGEAYELRDSAPTLEVREYYQEHVHRLRAQEYFLRNVWTDQLLRRRELRGLGALRRDDEEARRPWWKRVLGWK